MQLIQSFQRIIGSSPAYLELKVRLGKDSLNNIATKNGTDICIEGFPRSGNSFATSMFLLVNPNCRIAHHTHNFGNVKKAANLGIPTLVLIRHPKEAITSLCLYRELDPADSMTLLVEDYLYFYRGVQKIKNNSIVVADFSDVISNLNSVIERINTKFEQAFNTIEDIETAEKTVKEDYNNKFSKERLPLTQFPFPTSEKKSKKAEIRPFVEKQRQYQHATDLYKHLIKN